MISSSDSANRGNASLEILFHESSHTVSQIFQRVQQAATSQQVTIPPQLWHAVLFYTAGELTVRELKANSIDYVPYGGGDFYTSMCGAGCREKIAAHWTPRLDGTQSITDALSALVAAFK
jgi:hypothetical protein